MRNVRLVDVTIQAVLDIVARAATPARDRHGACLAPRLILLDEPAAGLSAVERRDLSELRTALPRSTAFLLIEHDLEIACRDRRSSRRDGMEAGS